MQFLENKSVLKKIPKGKEGNFNHMYRVWVQLPPHVSDIKVTGLVDTNVNAVEDDGHKLVYYYEYGNARSQSSVTTIASSACVYETDPRVVVLKNDRIDKILGKATVDGEIFKIFPSTHFVADGQLIVLYVACSLEVRACVVRFNHKGKATKTELDLSWQGFRSGGEITKLSVVEEILMEKTFNPTGISPKEFNFKDFYVKGVQATLASNMHNGRLCADYFGHQHKIFNIVQVCGLKSVPDKTIVIVYSFWIMQKNDLKVRSMVWREDVLFSISESVVGLNACGNRALIIKNKNKGKITIPFGCVRGGVFAHRTVHRESMYCNFKVFENTSFCFDRRLVAAGKNLYVCMSRQIHVYPHFNRTHRSALVEPVTPPASKPLEFHPDVGDRYAQNEPFSNARLLMPSIIALNNRFVGNLADGKEIDLGPATHLIELDESNVGFFDCKLFEPGLAEVLVFTSCVSGPDLCTCIQAVCAGKVIFKQFILEHQVYKILDFKFTKFEPGQRDEPNVLNIENVYFRVSGKLTVQLDSGALVVFDVFPSYSSNAVMRDLDREAREAKTLRLSTSGRRLSIGGEASV